MKAFFGQVGEGATGGVFHDTQHVPQDRPEFRSYYRRQLEKAAKKRKAEEMI
jgi:chlorophyllide a reductase subunit Y